MKPPLPPEILVGDGARRRFAVAGGCTMTAGDSDVIIPPRRGVIMKKEVFDLAPEQRQQLAALAALPDDRIDTADAPEVTDWSQARRGFFYRGPGAGTSGEDPAPGPPPKEENMAMETRVELWDDSLVVRIPAEVADRAGLQRGDAVSVAVKGDSLTVTPTGEPPVRLKEWLDRVTDENRHEEIY